MPSGRGDTTDRTRRIKGVDRRRFLKTTGVLTAAGLAAGCTGGDGGDGGDGGGGGGADTTTTTAGDGGDGGAGTTKSSESETFENEAGNKVGATFEAVKELAQDEQGATVYATIDRGPFQKWVKAFGEEYSDVNVNHITGGSEDLISRWNSEYKSNNVNADIYISTSKIKRTWQNGQVMELKPEFMPSFGDAPKKFRSQKNLWIATRQVLGSIYYNTEMVDPSAASSWMDVVTSDQFSDQKIGWDPTPNMFLMNWFFENQGKEFFQNLKKQRPRFVDSHTDLARFCGAGEYPVAFTYTHKMGRFGKKLPIDYFKFDPMPSVVSPGVINNKANSPNSAILFLNWLTSKQGQQVLGETQYIPWHPDAKYTAYEGVYPSDEYEVDTIDPATNTEKTQKQWKNIMGDLIG